MNVIDKTLAERGRRYGDFMGHAEITQSLKAIMVRTRKWRDLKADQSEALEMIAHKIGRILNGDPDYDDSWHDIAGYAQLVVERLRKSASANPQLPAVAISTGDELPEYVDRFLPQAPSMKRELEAMKREAKAAALGMPLTVDAAKEFLDAIGAPSRQGASGS